MKSEVRNPKSEIEKGARSSAFRRLGTDLSRASGLRPGPPKGGTPCGLGILLFLLFASFPACGAEPATNVVIVLEVENRVEFQPAGTSRWLPANTNLQLLPGDHLRTFDKSRALLQMYDLSRLRVDQDTILEITPPSNPREKSI